MSWYLKHHFETDPQPNRLKPQRDGKGNVDLHDLGFVQNVKRGDVVAEWVDLTGLAAESDKSNFDPKHIHEEKTFPMGRNTLVDPGDDNKLLADADGFAFYFQNKITVEQALDIRGNIDFNTGNILFVGDVTVRRDVRPGFYVRGRTIRINGCIEAAKIRAESDLFIDCGIKGKETGLLSAGGELRVGYAEHADVVACGKIMVQGSLVHCRVYTDSGVVAKGRIVGGEVVATRGVYCGEQLGGAGASASIVVGYSSRSLRLYERLCKRVEERQSELNELKKKAEKYKEISKELEPEITRREKELTGLLHKRLDVWQNMRPVDNIHTCKVIAAGLVRAGVEISIGEAYLKVDNDMENVVFSFRDNDIVIQNGAARK